MNYLVENEDDEIISIPVGKKATRSQGARNKAKGSNVERLYAKFFREIDESLSKCKTTRLSSKLLDDCKIDLNFLPILLQIKAGAQKGLSPSQVLLEMSEALKEHLPANYPEHKMPKAVIHHKDVPTGRRERISTDVIVHMTFEDWLILFLAFINQQKNDTQTK